MPLARRGLIGTATDLTRQHELEEQLVQAQKMEAVGQLTGGVAHDFNNLLTVILGNSELLVESLRDDEHGRRSAELILAAAKRGRNLTRQLMAFSRRQVLAPKNVDVNDLVRGMETILNHALPDDIESGFDLQESLPPIFADPAQVESALLNLAVNARDAMPNGGRLVIETATAHFEAVEPFLDNPAPGDYVVISVSDSGVGMPPEVARRAFEPFFTTKGVGEGSGLGLSMVHGFARQSGGTARIYSEAGKGTTVKIYLPAAADAAASPAPRRATEDDEVRGGSQLILVVEDDPTVRSYLLHILDTLGYPVEVAEDAETALELLRGEAPIEMLFSDVVLPGQFNGFELAEAAVLRRPGLKVLLTTGYGAALLTRRNGRPPFPILSKPYDRRSLAQALRRVLTEPAVT